MSDFWKRVDEELDYLGITRTYLANKCGFSLTNIGQGIKLGSTPSAETAVKIAEVLNVSVEYLVTGQERSAKKEEIDFKQYRQYASLISLLDLLPENQKVLAETVIKTMSKWSSTESQ